MAYFHNTNNTNIDDEINTGNNKRKIIKYGIISIVGLLFVFGIILIVHSFSKNRNVTIDEGIVILLEGDKEITIYQGTQYVEFGYSAHDRNGNDLTDFVVVSSNLDTEKVGEYKVNYAYKGVSEERIVKVISKGVGDTYLHLKGDLTIYLKVGESYVEPGYSVIDTVDGNLSDKVMIDGNVNTSKAGTYKLVYSVVNSAGVTTSGTRTVIVLASEMSLSLSNSNKTSGPIYINIYVNDNYFDYLVLPNGEKIEKNQYSYKVSSNGTYKFISYNTRGEKIEKSIKVSNIEIIKINMPKVYTSDNIGSGNKHSVGFLLKLTTDSSIIYYCTDSDNKCNPSTKYTGQLRFSVSQQKYLRYKACNSNNECSNIGSYQVNLSINLVNPSVSTSASSTKSGIANPYQAAYYYQCDSRWSSYDVYGGVTMCRVGCGYNAYTMILTAITHDYSLTPKTVFQQFKSFRSKYGEEFQSKSTGGGIAYYAPNNKYMQEKYGYVSNMFWKDTLFSAKEDSSQVLEEKKGKIVEALKMGHMIFLRVPVHYIALVGINENDEIYVFDPGWRTWMLDINELVDTYYNYNDNCNDKEECGFKVAHEIYATGGISLEDWRAIK